MQAATDVRVVSGVRGRRYLLLDERGVGLRATWHPGHGFINVSLWRNDRCVETFHLTPDAASDLIAFIVRAVASSVPAPMHQPLRVAPAAAAHDGSGRIRGKLWSTVRRRLADDLEGIAARLRR